MPCAANQRFSVRTRWALAGASGSDGLGAFVFAVIAICLLLPGCKHEPPPKPESIVRTAQRGPFTLTVEVSPAKAWVGDPITIDLRVHTPDDHVVQFPGEDAFGDLLALDTKTPDPRPGVDGGLDWRRTLTVESLASGKVEIPPLAVKYARKPANPDVEPDYEHDLAIEAIEVEIRSALTSRDSVLKPRDITGALTPPKPPRGPWFWVGVIAAGVILIALLVAATVWLRRRALRPPPPVLPEVWALRQLAALEAAGLIERGQAKQFYYSLSEVVRVYIERKFRLAAPEMTTEEFLTTLARDRGALPYDADRLRDFLTACDLVKYAALSPHVDDAMQALSSARAFVDATAAAAERAEQHRGGRAA